MEPSSKRSSKTKGPRVLANTVKKPEKSLNTSGNRSFSKNYIQDLRANNAKLAHSIAVERAKTREVYNRYVKNEQIYMQEKTEFRNISRQVKAGSKLLNDSLQKIIEGMTILSEVNVKLNTLYPELKEPQAPAAGVNTSCPPHYPIGSQIGDSRALPLQSVPLQTLPSQAVSSQNILLQKGPSPSVSTPKTDVPSPRQGAAMPMVQGQVISKPTISLQRVNVPLGFGKKNRPPIKPTQGTLVQDSVMLNRLSVVPEEMNNSREELENNSRTSLSPNHDYILPSGPPTVNTLPLSHVLLERIATDFTFPSNSSDHDDGQLTNVIFGSLGYSGNDSILVRSPPKVKQISPPKVNLTCDSDEYESASSSEDEELALQIVESKKSFTERKRQLDSKEGTSWNYDDSGKYRGRPPKRKKSAKNTKSMVKTEDVVSSQRDLRARPSQDDVTSPKPCAKASSPSRQMNIFKNREVSPKEEVQTNPMEATIRDVLDMSLTCVTANRPVHAPVGSVASPERPKELPTLAVHQENTGRNVFVTQRPRGRKPLPESPNSPLSGPPPLSPVSPIRKPCSPEENNENSPPLLTDTEEWSEVQSITRHIPQLNVVLERLPSNVISGNTYIPDCSQSSVQNLKSPDSHAPSTKHRFKCMLNNSVASSIECNKQSNDESWNKEKKTKPIPKARSKERKKLLSRSSEDSSSNSDSDFEMTPPSKKRSGACQNRKIKQEAEENSSNATKVNKRNTKSSKSSVESDVSGNLPSTTTSGDSNEAAEEHSSNGSRTKKRSARSVESNTSANSSSSSHLDGDLPHERPKRHAAPTNLKEPSVHAKLRRT